MSHRRNSWRREALVGAIVGAMFVIFAWLASRGWGELKIGFGPVRFGGDGWFDEWPLSSWATLIAGGGVLGSIVGSIRYLVERNRICLMSECARLLGLRHEPDVAMSGLGGDELFPGHTVGSHGYHGEYCGTPVDVVDVAETAVSQCDDSSDRTTHRTIVFLPAEKLPVLRLEPRTAANRMASALGMGISFDDSSLGSTSAATLEQFNRRWYLAIDDKRPDISARDAASDSDEIAIRRLFTPRLMESLGAFPTLFANTRAGRLLVWRKNGFLSAQQRGALLDDALRLREVLYDANARTTANRDVPVAAVDPVKRTERATGIAIGAVAGFFFGFFGGFGIFAWLMETRDPGARHELWFLMPVLAFGGAIVSAVVGAFAGRLLGRFLPQSRATGRRRLKLSVWRGLGLFLGFGAGALGELLVRAPLGYLSGSDGGPPPWVAIPLAFGCPIAGAIAGFWAGGRVESFLERRRMNAAPPVE